MKLIILSRKLCSAIQSRLRCRQTFEEKKGQNKQKRGQVQLLGKAGSKVSLVLATANGTRSHLQTNFGNALEYDIPH